MERELNDERPDERATLGGVVPSAAQGSSSIDAAVVSARPPFFVSVTHFDGPIDLLLHLVKREELEISELSLVEVTRQYLECIEAMRDLDLELAAEYLVVASTLLSLKASYLTGERRDDSNDDGTSESEGPSPHEELLRRLREAEVYHAGVRHLERCHLLGVDVFTAPPLEGLFRGEEPLVDHDVGLLSRAFLRLVRRLSESEGRALIISVDTRSVSQRMVECVDGLRDRGGVLSFEEVCRLGNRDGEELTRGGVIQMFVAVLELSKRGLVQIDQERTSDGVDGPIVVKLRSAEPMFHAEVAHG